MSKITVMAIAAILGGCSFTKDPDFCQIPAEDKDGVIKKVDAFIATITDDNVTYEMSPYLLKEGRLSMNEKGCWTYLLPKSTKPGWGVLDGDGGVYVNLETMEVGPVFWFRY